MQHVQKEPASWLIAAETIALHAERESEADDDPNEKGTVDMNDHAGRKNEELYKEIIGRLGRREKTA